MRRHATGRAQHLELELGNDRSRQGKLERSLAADPMTMRLLDRDESPARMRRDLPEAHSAVVDSASARAFVACIEIRTHSDPTRLTIVVPKAPAARTKPTEVFMRIARRG